MPFYEYHCQSCQHDLEVMQKITEAPLRKCPSCGRMTLVKLISAPVFRLKGSGWYETDFKSAQEAKRNLAASEPEQSKPAEAAKSPAKSEPAAATPSKPAAAAPSTPARKRAKSAPSAPARARAKGGAAKRSARGRSGR